MGAQNNNPKPSGRHEVHYSTARRYVVVDPKGQEVRGPYRDKNKALMARDRLRREADAKVKRMHRPCLCCGHAFQSEGIHNRLCDDCRHRDVAPDPLKVAANRARRAA
jgi:hypothetical protein